MCWPGTCAAVLAAVLQDSVSDNAFHWAATCPCFVPLCGWLVLCGLQAVGAACALPIMNHDVDYWAS
jgi:hypothetical protein